MIRSRAVVRFLAEHGMIVVVVLLVLIFSALTWTELQATGESGAEELAESLAEDFPNGGRVLIVTSKGDEDLAFANRLSGALPSQKFTIVKVVQGSPQNAGQAIQELADTQAPIDVIVCSPLIHDSGVWKQNTVKQNIAKIGSPKRVTTKKYGWPRFLTQGNLINVVDRVVVIAILAIGMTMVIVTAGIDLSVGSLIALSGVVTALFISEVAGGKQAGFWGMLGGAVLGILACGLMGLVSGILITSWQMPPFIVTLAGMLIARGIALLISGGHPIGNLPPTFNWLGRGRDLLGIPNSIVLMLILYAIAHVVMTHTTLGRYLYAVGGNPEAARLSGVPVPSVVCFAYLCSGLLAGVGGVLEASDKMNADWGSAQGWELEVIAAVVVGGTSLSGGEGKVLGTLLGALTLGVIRTGMNMTKVDQKTQDIVLGVVIIVAVLLDRYRHRLQQSAEQRPTATPSGSEKLKE